MSSENMTEYVKAPAGITLQELKSIVEYLINKTSDYDDYKYDWWNKSEYLNDMNIQDGPDKLHDYLNSGGRYRGSFDHSQRYGNLRVWYIVSENKLYEDPQEPCLKVEPEGDSYRVTIINQEESGAGKGGRRRRRRKRKSVKKTKKRRRRTRRRKRRRTRRRRRR